jgi:hypothetical protein
MFMKTQPLSARVERFSMTGISISNGKQRSLKIGPHGGSKRGGGIENEGITQNTYENKRDANLT